jgi:hypothetical protein
MAVITKSHMLNVIRRAYGPDYAESIREKLPDHLDPTKPEDMAVFYELGLTREHLMSALGGED